ncbi:bifunctional 4-hydroxy-2-oxoglutarate aldolase/2-dehydro-3-deoxy-phosphogluconate aldolase [Amycolatopsis acidicola]|uniref:Bifunctional 4-hydroxy-2-oxoglutarate aldolase/2-dehydro-3-deoxy-phosphogluconate aldolase n=1 Tax=Amycolatopsis acidicola TaxID=2596893 RepID=A0A5N0UTX3_9PSEU|nr:bifunctional 4-hydroxy-2-oxoglutarate aldolase/2-dehydro-3-deoxy-phosphogluconate aldolase [Amycolatopsis acidicola]KAA9154690.1 bifunctional 4-hydroxy-2-oxoglutarate aldolase/2-dehydro-3-deoxy-phosphogluconate aldolase [Amycolatopsis acidicola]
MDSAEFFEHRLAGSPVLGIFRNHDPAETVAACERAWEFGVELVEIPVQSPDAVPSLRAALDAARERGKAVGAGTVTTVSQLREVHELGAAFTVAPGLHPEVADESQRIGLPHLPGVATSTEIAAALARGYTWLKAFPAKQLGAEWITAQLAPFPAVRFVATGGIGAGNAGEFLRAGCRGVAVGSALEDPDSLPLLREAVSA